MSSAIFVNLPVKDLHRSRAFFTALGYSFNEDFSDENGACLVIGDENYVMLLTEPFFQKFTKKQLADSTASTEVITALAVESRQRVDEITDTALASGGSPSNEPMEEGPMYGRSFQDPDGHLWEIVYMDPSAFQ